MTKSYVVSSDERHAIQFKGIHANKITLAEDVYRRIYADIVAGRLNAGEKLFFARLKQRYGAGTSPLREALQRLTTECLVVSEGYIGFRVAPMSLDELVDINALRVLLEVRALRESIEHGDVTWEAKVLASSHQLARTPIPADPDSEDAEQWEERHRQFHEALISACPSRWTLNFCASLFSQFRRYRRVILRRYWKSNPLRKAVDAEHQRLVDAILKRDGNLAGKLLEAHYNSSAERVVAQFKG